jgi:MHS family proline/betaine transporter-like MFS transporter
VCSSDLGSLLIGYIGDKFGRNIALFWSMLIMTFSTLFIAFLPSYEQIGAWATVLLFLCRMLQVMSVAGELNGAAIFLIEILSKLKAKTKGLSSGLSWFFTVMGMYLGSIASYYSSVASWQWAFILGGCIGFFAIILRFLPKVKSDEKFSLVDVKNFNLMRSVISSMLLAAGLSGMFYYNMIFLSGYWQCTLDRSIVLKYNIYYFFIYAITALLSGVLSDYVKKRHNMMLFSALCIALLSFPTLFISNLNFHFINVIILAIYVGPSHAILFDLFPRQFRYRGVSIAYSIGTSIFGGSTSYISTYLASINYSFPAFWLIFISLLGFYGVWLGRKAIVQDKN